MRRNEVIDLQTYLPSSEAEEVLGAAATALPDGTSLLRGQYNLKAFLAAGGFGITYLAQDSLKRDVVVKECFPSELCIRAAGRVRVRNAKQAAAYEAIVEAFVLEAHSLAALDHRNIVSVHQVFKENSTAYMAIDFIDGLDVYALLEESEELPTPRLIRSIARKLLDAVRYIHARGMLHLDISPDNILIDAADEPVLIDFGAARDRSAAQEKTEWHARFVKDGYSPPEFYDHDAPRTAASDLYSLAASLHHMIVGDAPPAGDARKTAVDAGEPDPYVPLLGRIAGYEPEFLDAIDQCLRIYPADRLQSAKAWVNHISRPRRVNTRLASGPAGPAQHANASDDAAKLRRVMVDGAAGMTKPRQVKLPWPAIAALIALWLGALGVYVLTPSPVAAPAVSVTEAPAAEPLPTEPPAAAPAPADTVARPELTTGPGVPAIATARLNPLAPETGASKGALTPIENAPRSLRASALIAPAIDPGGADPAPSLQIPGRPVTAMPETESIATPAPVPDAAIVPIEAAGIARMPLPQIAAISSEPTPGLRTVGPKQPGVASGPVVYAHWDVEMPFRAEIQQVRKAHTATITEVSETAELVIAGQWIREGVVIYAFNGAPLTPDTDLSAHVLNALSVDPDGYARSSVQYRDPALGTIDRGLLAVPVVRRIGLADGTSLDLRLIDAAWQAEVRAPGTGPGNTLEPGDLILEAAGSDTSPERYEHFEQMLSRAEALGLDGIDMTVLRNGEARTARLPLLGGRP